MDDPVENDALTRCYTLLWLHGLQLCFQRNMVCGVLSGERQRQQGRDVAFVDELRKLVKGDGSVAVDVGNVLCRAKPLEGARREAGRQPHQHRHHHAV